MTESYVEIITNDADVSCILADSGWKPIMNDAAPERFPKYDAPPPLMHSHKQAKPILKLMTRALRGRKGQGLFNRPAKHKKPRIV